jgi:hypothetical protein
MGEPASVRYKNPGAMWGRTGPRPSAEREVATNYPLAVKWGSTLTVYLSDGLGQGNNIAVFPTFVQGICAQLDLWRTSAKYRNKRFADAIAIWSGGNEVASYIQFVLARVPGMTPDTVFDDAFWMSREGIAFLKAQAWHEAGKQYPASDADWIEARRRVFDGVFDGVDAPVTQPPPDIEPAPTDGTGSGPSIPPVIFPPSYPTPYPTPRPVPAPVPAPVVLPWWKRVWTKAVATVSGIFGGGFYFGGFKITPELILSLTLAASVAGIGLAVYFVGKHKNWWG